jgi:ribose transport system ATP-binding protein
MDAENVHSAGGAAPASGSPTSSRQIAVGDVILRIEHLTKQYPGTLALSDVSIEIERGTVHCLLGGNGSGKSTLIKVLAGVEQGEPEGTLAVGTKTVTADRVTPAWARDNMLHFVHQNPAVFPALTVAENMAIGSGFPTLPTGTIRWRALRRHTKEVLERFEVNAKPKSLVSDLRAADRTMVAIARALQHQSSATEGLLVLDEPTSPLPRHEVDLLLRALRRYADAGQTILFVTHRLDEVLKVADRVSVLRDGRLVATLERDELTEDRLVELIVGRALDRAVAQVGRVQVERERPLLEVSSLWGGPLQGVDLTLGRGELLGIAGLLGSGRTELLKMLFGAMRVDFGTIKLEGKEVRFKNVDQAMEAGLAFVPEDRWEGAFGDLNVRENLSAADVKKYWRHLLLRHRAEARDARASIAEFSIKANSDTQSFATLSGGNQQKVILARWLRRKPKLVLLDEPTQGVDVNARSEIYGMIRRAVAVGTSVIVVTSDLEELARVVDRAVVLRDGRIVAELTPPELSPATLTELVLSSTLAGTAAPGASVR